MTGSKGGGDGAGAAGTTPAWAEELRRRYLRGEASQFILHGNVFDVVEWGGELLPLGEYLTEHLLGENKDLIVVFNLATGGRIVRRKAELGGLEDLLVQRQPAKFLPAMERLLKTGQRVALIVEYAETVAPAADPALMQDDDRTAVVTLHRWSMSPEIEAADNVVLLLAENLSEVHPKLVSNPKIATVRLPMPDEETRRRVVAVCQPEADAGLARPPGRHHRGAAGGADAVHLAAGPAAPRTRRPSRSGCASSRGCSRPAGAAAPAAARPGGPGAQAGRPDPGHVGRGGAHADRPRAPAPSREEARRRRSAGQEQAAKRDEIDRLIAHRKREIIERECYGLIEFVEPGHDFRVVGGIEAVKAELQRIARNIREGNVARVPMGLLFTGPMGAGKTFVAEAFAKESGLTTIKLKNFRSKWVGATEANLERILQVVQAIGQVLVIIDEGDRAFGNQSDGDGDGGTSSRVIGRLKEFMSDTATGGGCCSS